MNVTKTFAKMIKEHCKGNAVTCVTNHDNIRTLAKLLISLPDTYIESFTLQGAETVGYDRAWILTYGTDSEIYCERAYRENGKIARGDGVYYIDTKSIGDERPENFVVEGEATVKIIGDVS